MVAKTEPSGCLRLIPPKGSFFARQQIEYGVIPNQIRHGPLLNNQKWPKRFIHQSVNFELELPFVAIAAAVTASAITAAAAAVTATAITTTAAAVTATAIATVTATAVTAAKAATPAAFFARFSLFYDDCAAIEFSVVERLDCCARLIVIWHFYETKTSGTAGFFV